MMLILSPLRESQLGHHQLKDEKQFLGDGDYDDDNDDDDHEAGESSSFDFNGGNNNGAPLDFPEFSGGMGNLLDTIDFDDLFIGIHDGDVLPDLEMDSDMLDFSVSSEDFNNANTTPSHDDQQLEEEDNNHKVTGHAAAATAAAAACITSSSTTTTTNSTTRHRVDEEIASRFGDDDDDEDGDDDDNDDNDDNGDGNEIRAARRHPLNPKQPSGDQKSARKSSSSSAQSKNSHGKRKVKVDWTPELHRRFVQAVEQLGVDKAVPSRILELMGIDCLTRHNIASHLQKYRSHRKHLLAREAEAASWTQRRQMYAGGGGRGGKNSASHDVMMMNNSPNWLNAAPPTMGFPPPITTNTSSTPPPMHPAAHHHPLIRPLHVWGHPTMDQPMMHMWPKHHLPHNFPSPIPIPPPPPVPTPAGHAWPPPPDASYWHHTHPNHHRAPISALTPGAPCFPRQMQRFAAPPVPGIPPHVMFKTADPTPPQPAGPHSALVDFHPSKESIDAAIGDVISKPWLPLPLGLKPPATDTVMVELQRQGIPKIPPSCA